MSGETATIMQAWASVGSIFATLLVGAAKCALIVWGLRQISRASASRDKALDALITGMTTVIERTERIKP